MILLLIACFAGTPAEATLRIASASYGSSYNVYGWPGLELEFFTVSKIYGATLTVATERRGTHEPITGNTVISISAGAFSFSRPLSADPSWSPGKGTATFELPLKSQDILLDSVLQGRAGGQVRIFWTERSFTVSVTFADPEIAPLLVEEYDTQPGKTLLPATVQFGNESATRTLEITTNVQDAPDGTDILKALYLIYSVTSSGQATVSGPPISSLLVGPKDVRTNVPTLNVALLTTGQRVFGVLNGGADIPLTNTGEDWTDYRGKFTLKPGPNELQIFSEDGTPEGVTVVKKQIFYEVATEVVTEVEGPGTISPPSLLGVTQQFISSDLQVTAVPAPGYVFAGWSGAFETGDASVTAKVAPGLQLMAHFAPRAFTFTKTSARAGFSALDGGGSAWGGRIDLATTTAGAYTGKLFVRGRTVAFRGQLAANGSAQVTLPAAPGQPELRLSLVLPETGSGFTGSISAADGSFSAELDGLPLPYTARSPVPGSLVGAYLVHLGEGTRASGLAVVRLTRTGTVSVTGRFLYPAGLRPFAATGNLTGKSTVAFYAPLYGPGAPLQGALAGLLQLGFPGEARPSCTGSLALRVDKRPTRRDPQPVSLADALLSLQTPR